MRRHVNRDAIAHRPLALRAATTNEAARTVQATLATEARVFVFDRRRGEVIEEILLMAGAEIPAQVPLIDSHSPIGTTDDILGSARSMRVAGRELGGVLHFADDEASDSRFLKVKGGHITDVSIGYVVHDSIDIAPGRSEVVDGTRYQARELTLRIARRWQVVEVSLVAVGADQAAKVRAARARIKRQRQRRSADNFGESNMPYTPPRRRGLDRSTQIRAIAAGLMLRAGIDVIDRTAPDEVQLEQERDAGRGDAWRDRPLIEIAREALRIEDIEPGTNAASDWQLMSRVFSTAAIGEIFTTVAGASLMRGFETAPDTTEGWCVEGGAVSFVSGGIVRVGLGASGRLEKLGRGGTAKDLDMGAATRETWTLARFARKFQVDEQDLIDDNAAALTSIPMAMGEAAKLTRPDLVYAILLANPALSDGVALFHSGHGNTASSALSQTSIGAGLKAMAEQSSLGLQAKYLLAPPGLAVDGAVMVRLINDGFEESSRLVVRPEHRLGVAGVKDPMTGINYAGSITMWILATAAQRTIEVAYLEGRREPTISQYLLPPGEGKYGIGFSVKLDIAAAAIDYRGLYRGNS